MKFSCSWIGRRVFFLIQNLYDDNIFYGETVSKFEYLPILKGNGSKKFNNKYYY